MVRAATRWCRAAGGREGWPAAPTLAPLPAGQAGRRARGGWAVGGLSSGVQTVGGAQARLLSVPRSPL